MPEDNVWLQLQTSPLNVRRKGGVTMAEKYVSMGSAIAGKPRRYQVDEGLDVRFLRHANSAHCPRLYGEVCRVCFP